MVFAKGHIKTGGRQKGTPNKKDKLTREWLQMVLDGQRATFEAKLKKLPPKEYCTVYVGLLGYVTPKQQSISVEQQIESEYKQLRLLMTDAPEKVVEAITQRISILQNDENTINPK